MRFSLYKAPNGNWYTESLFYELWVNLPIDRRVKDPVFTFTDGRPGYTSFKQTFLELGDPTGYEWAMKYLSSYDHWVYLMKRDWFSDQVDKALVELSMKQRASALKKIELISIDSKNEATALAASKYLAEQAWNKNRVGRPEKLQPSLKKEIDAFEADALRIGLTVIPGGKV